MGVRLWSDVYWLRMGSVAGLCEHGNELRIGYSGRILWKRQWTEDGVQCQDFVNTTINWGWGTVAGFCEHDNELRMGYSDRILWTRQWTEDGVILLTNKVYNHIHKHMHWFLFRSKWLQAMHLYRWASRCIWNLCVVYLWSTLVLSFHYA